MRTKELIVVEDVLERILYSIPSITFDGNIYYPISFGFGNNKQLADFLRQKKQERSVYPLVWLVYPLTERHTPSAVYFDNMQLIVAVENYDPMLNDQRLKTTYKNILMQVANDIVNALRRSNVSNIENEVTIVKFPNYSDDKSDGAQNHTQYVWDAIKITVSGSFSSNCLKPIYLNP